MEPKETLWVSSGTFRPYIKISIGLSCNQLHLKSLPGHTIQSIVKSSIISSSCLITFMIAHDFFSRTVFASGRCFVFLRIC